MRKLLFAVLLGGCQSTPARVTLATAPRVPPPAAIALPQRHDPPVRVVYRGILPSWRSLTMTWLHGVDAAHGRAWVSHESINGTDEFELVEIDLHTRTEKAWFATKPDAHAPAFHPLTGGFEEDLARYASMVEATGPFVVRARDYTGPHLAVTKDWIAYESDPDRLMLARRDGSHAVRLDGGQYAAYQPIFSPHGSRVAFTGCNVRSPIPPGALHRCPYRVFVTRIGAAPVGYDVMQPQPPTFSPDGRFVYAASRDDDHAAAPHDHGGCADRIDLESGRVVPLFCTSELHDVDLETGARAAVFHGWRGKLGEQIEDYVWLELPSGKLRGTVSVDRGTSNASYGGGDYVFASSQRGLVAVDLRSGKQAILPGKPGSSPWVSNQWKDDHTVYALSDEPTEGTYEILEVDARAMLAELQ